MADGKPGLLVFDTCKQFIDDIQAIQASEKDPNDCATEPHDITHLCLTGDTLVRTTQGDIPIEELVGKEGDVYCWDGEQITTSHFDSVCMTSDAAEVFEVELEDGTKIKATANHKMLTAAGWKELKDITSDDEILQF